MAPMSRRSNGAGTVFIKHGNYYGRWYTPAGGRANRKLGPVRRPGTASGLTRAQAEKRLREMMSARDLTTRPNGGQLASHRGVDSMARSLSRRCASDGLQDRGVTGAATQVRRHGIPD